LLNTKYKNSATNSLTHWPTGSNLEPESNQIKDDIRGGACSIHEERIKHCEALAVPRFKPINVKIKTYESVIL
jgi:hypothetical protein